MHGVDREGAGVGALRLWRFTKAHVMEKHTYILRGMHVAYEQTYDHQTGKYAPHTDGKYVLDCTFRTAAEDVSSSPVIQGLFRWRASEDTVAVRHPG